MGGTAVTVRTMTRCAAAVVTSLRWLTAGTAAPTAVAAEPGTFEGSALEDFGACLAARHGGDLVLLIDESGSLEENDPEASRVTAATYLVDQIATTGRVSGFTLDVAVAAFAANIEVVQGWTRLDDAGLEKSRAAIASFAQRDDGAETDYWNAL